MDHDDPFAGVAGDAGDRTVIRPRPGGRGPAATPPPPPRQASHAALGAAPLPPRQGANPLVNAAAPLLALLGRLPNTPSHPDPAGLRNNVINEIKAFETRAENQGVDRETLFWARYVLCSALDELVLGTPWGSTSIWQKQSLLITFHNEASGGEKFFQLLHKLLQNPARNLDLLELMYLCLAFGFQGRYRLLNDGYSQLQKLQDELYLALRAQRGEYERELSPHWQGMPQTHNTLIQYLPLWVVFSVAGALLLAVYFGFSLSLNAKSDPVYQQLHDVAQRAIPVVSRPKLAPRPPPEVQQPRLEPPIETLESLLTPEVRAGQVVVKEQGPQTTVSIQGDGLFASGSVRVSDAFQPLLQRIAAALDRVPGRIVVVGHTDNIPIRSLRFPSNWHLSRARAQAVAKILAAHLSDPRRLQSEGRGSAEPLVANDTPKHRARNRRVEIRLINNTKRTRE